jgi:hypothetical protein
MCTETAVFFIPRASSSWTLVLPERGPSYKATRTISWNLYHRTRWRKEDILGAGEGIDWPVWEKEKAVHELRVRLVFVPKLA